MEKKVVDPTKDNDTVQPESPADTVVTVNKIEKIERPEPAPAPVIASRFSLFKYVTLLASGLSLIGLLSAVGFTLLDHWLSEPKDTGYFSEYLYQFHLYLLVALVLTAGLHIWMRFKTTEADAEGKRPARVFRAIFLTVLVLTILGAVIAIAHLVADLLFGTANYTMKGIWQSVLGSLQVAVWSSLALWYFRTDRPGSRAIYAGVVGVLTLAVAVLLVTFPIMSKRDSVIDTRTSNDVTAITSSISKYVSKNNKLPDTLSDVKLDDERVTSRLGAYEYQKTEPKLKSQTSDDLGSFFSENLYRLETSSYSYKICATFKTDTSKDDEDGGIIPLLTSSSSIRKHPAGKHCFDQTAYGKSDSSSSSGLEGLLGGSDSL